MNWINWKQTGEREREREKHRKINVFSFLINAKAVITSALNNVKIVGKKILKQMHVFFF